MLWETVLVVIRKHHITGTFILSPNSLLTSFSSPKAPSQPSQLWTSSCVFCPRIGVFFLQKPRCEMELLHAEGSASQCAKAAVHFSGPTA